jgi:hypothetical protein
LTLGPRAVLVTVAAIVVARSLVLVFVPASQFDSDQAVIGLMAKHLAEGRAFPVFMYGQSYILGVEAWMAAPLFFLFGASAALLKLPLLIINVAVAVLLVQVITRETGLRPVLGAVAAAPFLVPAPGTTARFLEAGGGNVEPFLYVILLWLTRERPWLCGLILGVGFLQREFTIYGLLALIALAAADRSLFTRPGLERFARVALAAALVWAAVQGLRQISSAAGPGTSIANLAGAPNNLAELLSRTCVSPRTLAIGAGRLFRDHWPTLLGTARYPLTDFGIESRVWQGLEWSWVLPAAAALLAIAGIAFGDRAVNRIAARSICGYLVLVGFFSVAGYVAGRCGELNFYTTRYELLSISGFAGLGAWFLRTTRSKPLAGAWIAVVLCWTLVSSAAHARLGYEYLAARPKPPKATVIETLEREGVKYGRSDYWMAYYISFMTQERIVVAATDFVRVRTYNRIVDQHAAEVVTIARAPCAGGREIVRGVYLCR